MIDIHDELRQLVAKLDEHQLWKKESEMPKVDMSAAAVTTRLKRVAQLRRLGLSLQNAKIKREEDRPPGIGPHTQEQSEPRQKKSQ